MAAAFAAAKGLLFTERFTVGALIHSRIGLVSTYQNPIQGTVVCFIAVICALRNGAFNTLICFAVHFISSFFMMIGLVCTKGQNPFYFPAPIIDISVSFEYNSMRKTTNFQNNIF